MMENDSDSKPTPAPAPSSAEKHQRPPGVKPGSLRRIRILSDLDSRQLGQLLDYLDVVRVRQFSPVVSEGDHGDSMFFVLEGEVRARIMIDGKETWLATMEPGEFFGEISVLDQGPRSSDIVANADSVLLKLSADDFRRLLREAPDLAAGFLFALSRSVVGRLRKLTKRYHDSIHFSHLASSVNPLD